MLVNKIYDALYRGEPISSYEIIRFLDNNQDLIMLNSSIKQRSHEDLKDKVDIKTFDEIDEIKEK